MSSLQALSPSVAPTAPLVPAGTTTVPPRALYPPIEPYSTGFLEPVHGDPAFHRVYYEESGSPLGVPVIFLHGGPGGGCSPIHRQFFDPSAYRIVLMDQRGCGKSTPFAELEGNTTWDLVADIERLRAALGIEAWGVVFGGSWGSTLALAYAQAHADRVRALVLRGIFCLRKVELDFFYEAGGAHMLYPDAWEAFLAPIPEAERGDLTKAYHARLTSADAATRGAAAKAWSVWEGVTSKLHPDGDFAAHYADEAFALAFARIENHYFVHKGFFAEDGQLLLPHNVAKIRHIPAVIVQSRYDVVCPMATAWELHKAWPEAAFKLVPDAGHSAFEPGVQRELLNATDSFRPSKAA